MKFDFKKLVPHVIAVVIFLIVALVYCKPALEGKVVNQHDNLGWKGMAQQSFEYKEKYGRFPLWSNSMFGGMPAYQIAMDQDYPVSNQWMVYVLTLGLPKPMNFFFLACICFYLLCLVLRINPWIGMAGAISYAYATYNPVIVAVGHDTKMLAIGYAPLVIAGFLLLFQKRWALGITALAAGFSLQMSTGHLQIVYYTLLIAGFITLGYLVDSVRKKELKSFFISIALAVCIGLMGVATNAINTLTTYEYSKESMRGGESELKDAKQKNTTSGGLDKDYAFRWSYGISETLTLLAPGIYGGSNGGAEFKTSKFADKLMEVGYPEDQALQGANQYAYWGDQPGTSGPVYLGAIICLLFVLGMFIETGWLKWSLFAASVFGILLAWGKNLEGLNYFLFDYLPLYKKFRAPSMGLVMPAFCFALLASVALNTIVVGKIAKEVLLKKLKTGGIAIGGLCALLILFYFTADYTSPNDKALKENMSSAMLQQAAGGQQPTAEMQQQAESFGKGFVTALHEDRQALYGSDLIRTILLIAVAFTLLWLAVAGKIKPLPVMLALLVLTSFDLLAIGKRYLNDNNYVDKTDYEGSFTMSEADQQIKNDKGYYRVFNQAGDVFNESTTSYHHNSIGGYHPAKLQIYQDLIENQISKNNMQVLNMLNTKYFIFQNPQTGKPIAQQNPEAFGPCWLVKGIKYVANGKEEMSALDSTNLRDTAVIQTRFKEKAGPQPVYDSSAFVKLVENRNDVIVYNTSAATNQFAVLSEIYYSAGWNAYIDGKKTDYVKTNYALRGIAVPAGNHKLEFKFEPQSYKTGNLLMLIGTILIFVCVVGGLFMEWKQQKKAA
jgi:hypothetical protein